MLCHWINAESLTSASQCILESRYFCTSTRETNESECNCNEPERWEGIYQGLVIDHEAEQWINQHHLRAAREGRSSRHRSFNPNKMPKLNFQYKKTENIQLTRQRMTTTITMIALQPWPETDPVNVHCQGAAWKRRKGSDHKTARQPGFKLCVKCHDGKRLSSFTPS